MSVQKKRLLWLCRRGIREMDLLFKQYIDDNFDSLNQTQLEILESFMNEADLDIIDWIMERREVTNPSYQLIIDEMKNLKSKHPQEN